MAATLGRMKRLLAFLAVLAALLMVPSVAWAQTVADQVGEIEVGLVGMFPLVILISSLLLSPAATEKVKVLLPAVVSLIVAVIYFVVEAFPGFGEDLVVQLGLLIGLAQTLYNPVSALVKLLTGWFGRERGLNEVTGSGLVGRA